MQLGEIAEAVREDNLLAHYSSTPHALNEAGTQLQGLVEQALYDKAWHVDTNAQQTEHTALARARERKRQLDEVDASFSSFGNLVHSNETGGLVEDARWLYSLFEADPVGSSHAAVASVMPVRDAVVYLEQRLTPSMYAQMHREGDLYRLGIFHPSRVVHHAVFDDMVAASRADLHEHFHETLQTLCQHVAFVVAQGKLRDELAAGIAFDDHLRALCQRLDTDRVKQMLHTVGFGAIDQQADTARLRQLAQRRGGVSVLRTRALGELLEAARATRDDAVADLLDASARVAATTVAADVMSTCSSFVSNVCHNLQNAIDTVHQQAVRSDVLRGTLTGVAATFTRLKSELSTKHKQVIRDMLDDEFHDDRFQTVPFEQLPSLLHSTQTQVVGEQLADAVGNFIVAAVYHQTVLSVKSLVVEDFNADTGVLHRLSSVLPAGGMSLRPWKRAVTRVVGSRFGRALVERVVDTDKVVRDRVIGRAAPVFDLLRVVQLSMKREWSRQVSERLPKLIRDADVAMLEHFYQWVDHVNPALDHVQQAAFRALTQRVVLLLARCSRTRLVDVARAYLYPVWKHWVRPDDTVLHASTRAPMSVTAVGAHSSYHESFKARTHAFLYNPGPLTFTILVCDTVNFKHTHADYDYWCSVWLCVHVYSVLTVLESSSL